MKPKPFDRIKVGEIFRDIDGTILMRTEKTFANEEGKNILNCAILIPNISSLKRGDVIGKTRDTYCESLNDREVSEIRLAEEMEISTVKE